MTKLRSLSILFTVMFAASPARSADQTQQANLETCAPVPRHTGPAAGDLERQFGIEKPLALAEALQTFNTRHGLKSGAQPADAPLTKAELIASIRYALSHEG